MLNGPGVLKKMLKNWVVGTTGSTNLVLPVVLVCSYYKNIPKVEKAKFGHASTYVTNQKKFTRRFDVT
jgi:hypothetical protein